MNMAAIFTPIPLDLLLSNTVDLEDIPGLYKEAGRLVREILGPMSLRHAMRKTTVSHTTISSMANGDRPGMEKVVDFGRGMKADVNALLRAFDYPEIKISQPAQVSEDRATYNVNPITRELIRETIDIAAQTGEVTQEEADEIRAILERRRREAMGE